jgi:hypothetical protein
MSLVPQVLLFVFINHSQHPELEAFHGKAIRLDHQNTRVPFHGAFLIREMRVRGRWPRRRDRPISLSSLRSSISETTNPDRHTDGTTGLDRHGDSGGHNEAPSGGGVSSCGNDTNLSTATSSGLFSSLDASNTGQQRLSSSEIPSAQDMIILSDPFKDPAHLETLKRSFALQPNWKAAMLEGQRFDGTADENIQRYKNLVTMYAD